MHIFGGRGNKKNNKISKVKCKGKEKWVVIVTYTWLVFIKNVFLFVC